MAQKLALSILACFFATDALALESVPSFGTNPGKLAMFRYVPKNMPSPAPLVLALHGCTQTAEAFANTGLDQLADEHKFYVVYAQQDTANNPVSCFDWFGQYNAPANKANIQRGHGESESIKEMVDKMKADFSVDPGRVFVIGFSAGGAMAAVMLADWPDVFQAGGIAAGVPYDCPSMQNADVWQCQNPGKMLAPSDWGDRVRAAFPGYSGPYPRVSIWQGTMDYIVSTSNTQELVKQWTNVHGLAAMPARTEMVDGYPHAVYADAGGVVKVESYAITGMDHAVAVDPSKGCGTAGQYVEDKHICTVRHMLEFFGIAGAGAPPPDPPAGGGTPPPDPGRPNPGAPPPSTMTPNPEPPAPLMPAGGKTGGGGCSAAGQSAGSRAGGLGLLLLAIAFVAHRFRGRAKP